MWPSQAFLCSRFRIQTCKSSEDNPGPKKQAISFPSGETEAPQLGHMSFKNQNLVCELQISVLSSRRLWELCSSYPW